MGIFRSITKITHLSKSHKPIFSLRSILNPTSLSLSKTHPLSPSLSKWVPPLFHSSHPSTRSQYAPPFCLQFDVVLPPSFQALVSPNFSRVNFGVKRVGSGEENVGGGDPVKKGGVGGGGGVDGFVNLPNLISMSRLIPGPVIGWMILQEMYLPAFVGLAVSGATDWLDGYVARKMGINSVVGSYLDPLADKVLIGSVALAMVDKVF